MKKLLCGALALACLSAPASAMSYFTPSNVTIACTIAQAVEATVLSNEQLANDIAGKTVVRTGTTTTIKNVTPTICSQITAAAIAAQAAAASSAK